MPWGSAQVIEKARLGEGNARISFGLFWPAFAGAGPGFARFGFGLENIWIYLAQNDIQGFAPESAAAITRRPRAEPP
jgi:hypothetical protein